VQEDRQDPNARGTDLRLTVNGKQVDVASDPDATPLGHPREARAHRHEVRVWHGAVRLLHRAHRWPSGPLVRHAHEPGRGQATKFAIESFIDEIARAQRIDPVAFRLRLLAHDDRAARVVRAAARMAEWERRRKGRGLGFAFSDTWRSYIGAVAEVSVDRPSGKIRVHEVWCAVDPGIAIQPDNVVAQIEGAAIFGVSAALTERITIENGVVQQSNFHDYPLLRMADAPDIHVDLLTSEQPPGGIGEVGLPPMGGAIANAVAALTGARVRALPMLPDRVQAALKEVPARS
jgi:isoquinoline 1-oxidoreductase beta subunit